MANIKAFVSWSGGKDSALACYRAMKEELRFAISLTCSEKTEKCLALMA
jgi:diphthamide synthase (EF-2-diphthine--ammonia ligase)